jgi:hypothetical protein
MFRHDCLIRNRHWHEESALRAKNGEYAGSIKLREGMMQGRWRILETVGADRVQEAGLSVHGRSLE